MKRIAIDMDEVLTHFSASCLDLFNTEFNTNYTTVDLLGKKLVELDARFDDRVDHYLASESFFLDLKVVKDSQEVIQKLSEHYEIYIVTAAMEFPSSLAPKYQWLKQHFNFLNEHNFVFCGDKSIVHADYLIDDTPIHLDTFTGQGILFTAPHNLNITGYQRLNNWQKAADYFLSPVL